MNTTHAIRPESNADLAAIDLINNSAFGDEGEARLVGELRHTDAYIPDLSLVAEEGGRVAGHLMLFRTRLVTPRGDSTILTLAPTAVVPSRTHRGIGTEMVQRGLDRARDMAYPAVIVVGFPDFYLRIGFRPIREYGLTHTLPVSDEFITAMELSEGSLAEGGRICHPQAFRAYFTRAVND